MIRASIAQPPAASAASIADGRQAQGRERRAAGDGQLIRHEVPPEHELRDRVLHLESCVELEEDERPVGRHQELARPGVDVAGGPREADRRVPEPAAHAVVEPWRRRLLHDLLVPPLERAVAVAEVDDIARVSPRTWTSTWRASAR